MKMKHFILTALAAIFALACQPQNAENNGGDNGGNGGNGGGNAAITAADLVGTWENTSPENENSYEFTADGKYVFKEMETTENGTFTLKDGVLTLSGGESPAYTAVLAGGKAALALVEDYEDEFSSGRRVSLYYKKGATVVSPAPGEGRWDAPHDCFEIKQHADDDDLTAVMIIKGTTVDLYFCAWALHIQGTWAVANGKFNITDRKIREGAWYDALAEGYVWWAGDAPYENAEEYDPNLPSFKTEALDIQKPYVWYDSDVMTRGNAITSLCSFPFVLSDDGKTAFFTGVGQSKIFYKR